MALANKKLCAQSTKSIIIFTLLFFSIIFSGYVEAKNNSIPDGSKTFKKGYKDGCKCGEVTAGKHASWKQDYKLYNNNPEYKDGWTGGFFKCLGEIKSNEKTEEAVKIAQYDDDIINAQVRSYFFLPPNKAFAIYPLSKTTYRWTLKKSSPKKARQKVLKGCGPLCILFADGDEIVWEKELVIWEQTYIDNKDNYSKGLDKYKNTILHALSLNNHLEYAKRVIKNNADINITNTPGATPFYFAVLRGHYDMAELLIKNGANINKSLSNKFTPLMVAAERGYLGLVKLLIENGADKNLKNNNTATALGIAKAKGHNDIVKLLEN